MENFGATRGRVLPNLPYKEDFKMVIYFPIPALMILHFRISAFRFGARMRWQVQDMEENKVAETP